MAPDPYKRALRGLGLGTAPGQAMAVIRMLAGFHANDRREAMTRVEAGDWDGLFDYIRGDRHRWSENWVREAFGHWAGEQMHAGSTEIVHQKLKELHKRMNPLHLDDLRGTFSRLGEGLYRGYSNKHMLETATSWDPKGRPGTALKEHLRKARPYFWSQALSLSFQCWGKVSAPATNISHVQ